MNELDAKLSKLSSEVEERIRYLGGKMASFDPFFDQLRVLVQKNVEHDSFHKDLKTALEEEAKKRAEGFKVWEGIKQNLEKNIRELSEVLSVHAYLHEDTQGNVKNTQNSQAQHAEKISDLHSKSEDIPILKRDISSHKSAFEGHRKMVSDRLDSHEGMMKSLGSMIGDLKAQINSLMSVDHDSIRKREREVTDLSMKGIVSDYKSNIIDLKKSIESSLVSLEKSLKNDISKIKVPSDQDLDNAAKAAQVLASQEGVSLDAKNAILRSSNCETKLAILEKKIDRLMLLTARLEFSQ